jgi:hypothetical protein
MKENFNLRKIVKKENLKIVQKDSYSIESPTLETGSLLKSEFRKSELCNTRLV